MASSLGPFRAVKCPCGHATCKNWLIEPIAAVQGVSFTARQATAVAAFLNGESTVLAAIEPLAMAARAQADDAQVEAEQTTDPDVRAERLDASIRWRSLHDTAAHAIARARGQLATDGDVA